jgi:hypothetical protein
MCSEVDHLESVLPDTLYEGREGVFNSRVQMELVTILQ